jgi:hypothetical protein
MAARNPASAHPGPPEEPVPFDRLLGVVGAGRLVAAGRRHRREDEPVEMDQCDPDSLHFEVGPPRTPARMRSLRSTPTSASWSVSTIPGRAMMRTSQPGWNEGAITLSASRSRRRTRLRTTAVPSRRPVARPIRVVSRSVRRNRAERIGWDREAPRSWIAAKSCGRESITRRGGRVPRSLVRPSGASDREPGAPPGRDGRRRSSSGRESRVPWRDDAFWAGRSASSGLRAILSIRPRGLVRFAPRGTQTRHAPVGAAARSSSGG